jgi:hypothetical protein
MKKSIISGLLSVLIANAACGEEISPPHVTVFGTATIEVIPDQMVWSLKIESKGPMLDVVAGEHAKAVEAVLNLLKDAKVEGKVIQTSHMEFGENREYRDSKWVKEGYFAATSVSFKITDFELYQKLWLGLAKIPQVSVESVEYDHTRRIEYQNETRQKAVLAAREKAAAMARALGSEIGDPLLLDEDVAEESHWGSNSARNNLRVISNDEEPQAQSLALGTIPIKTRVRASFRLMKRQK